MSDDHQWYFAYGSNMDPERLRSRNVGVLERRAATLVGWRLAFDKRSRKNPAHTAANIHPDPHPDAAVEGALCLIEATGLGTLDRLEGVPIHYRRRRVDVIEVSGATRPVDAWTYVAAPEWRTDPAVPPDGYLRHLLAGADVLSDAYRHSLERLAAPRDDRDAGSHRRPSQTQAPDLGSES